MVTVCWGGSK
jgi:hypothetical protein